MALYLSHIEGFNFKSIASCLWFRLLFSQKHACKSLNFSEIEEAGVQKF